MRPLIHGRSGFAEVRIHPDDVGALDTKEFGALIKEILMSLNDNEAVVIGISEEVEDG